MSYHHYIPCTTPRRIQPTIHFNTTEENYHLLSKLFYRSCFKWLFLFADFNTENTSSVSCSYEWHLFLQTFALNFFHISIYIRAQIFEYKSNRIVIFYVNLKVDNRPFRSIDYRGLEFTSQTMHTCITFIYI